MTRSTFLRALECKHNSFAGNRKQPIYDVLCMKQTLANASYTNLPRQKTPDLVKTKYGFYYFEFNPSKRTIITNLDDNALNQSRTCSISPVLRLGKFGYAA